MSTGKILTNEQAKAIADAMAYLNNINGRLHARIPHALIGRAVHVKEGPGGGVECYIGDRGGSLQQYGPAEQYQSQAAFLEAYGITQGLMSVPLEEAL